ncbi:MAG: hypothetical protein KF871_04540 [Hydrogenophaga sp.]|uniref:NEL-type E3 ubiquitin ligase domain-containing protein n=1 Tax=Hydrogenophaga sp. TaxID=1904254 RepID=UPI001D53FB02|nr:NEL-type E3 ubiquitin ligase domain-containing protein [Hydrogenophaga sp.]MBX3609144.1 hypothetical protein [Hydrogenophaga sp.]
MSIADGRIEEFTLGDQAEAIELLCDKMAECIDSGTRIVFAEHTDIAPLAYAQHLMGEVTSGLARRCPDWARRHSLEPLPVTLWSTTATNDPPVPGAKAQEVSRASAAERNAVKWAFGHPNDADFLGLVVIKHGPLTPPEVDQLKVLQAALPPDSLLVASLDVDHPDAKTLAGQLRGKIAADTPMVVIQGQDDGVTLYLTRSVEQHMGITPDIHRPTGERSLMDMPGLLDRCKMHWVVQVHRADERYKAELESWIRQEAQGKSLEQVMEIANDLLAGIVWTSPGEANPAAVTLDLAGIERLPPFPPGRVHKLSLLNCDVEDFRHLPASLTHLRIVNRARASLALDASRLPRLNILSIEHMSLEAFPDTLLAFSWMTRIHLLDVRMPQAHLLRLRETQARADYDGPTFLWPGRFEHQDTSGSDDDQPPTPHLNRRIPRTHSGDLADTQDTLPGPSAVAVETPLWTALHALIETLPGEELTASRQHIEETLGNPAFVQWVQRLSRLAPRQRNRVVPGLVDLITCSMKDEDLRHHMLAIVEDASISCNDRITLSWERVHQLRQCQSIRLGLYDGQPSHVLAQARQAFRQETLTRIAMAHVRQRRTSTPADRTSTQDIEEVEICLAFSSQAAGPLNMTTEMGFGLYVGEAISGVSLLDVSRAIKQVRREENERFTDFLAQWDPWLAVLRRLAPDAMEQIDDQLADLDQIERWRRDMAQQAAESGLMGRDLESAVTRALAQRGADERVARQRRLTEDTLHTMGLTHLLRPAWQAQ